MVWTHVLEEEKAPDLRGGLRYPLSVVTFVRPGRLWDVNAPLSTRAILTLLYSSLGLVALLGGGSPVFMLMGALCADLFALLLVNVGYHLPKAHRGKDGESLSNSVVMLLGGSLLGYYFLMFGLNLALGMSRTKTMDRFGALLADNGLGMLTVMAGAGLAYALAVRGQVTVDSATAYLRGSVVHRMFMLMGMMALMIAVGFMFYGPNAGVVVFVLFLLRALMEWGSLRFWRWFDQKA